MGISAISFVEMQSFFDLYWIIPDVEEVDMIRLFDRVALKIMQEQNEKEQNKTTAKSKFDTENKNESSP